MEILLDGARGIAALTLAASMAWLGYRLALWWLPRAGPAARWSAAAVAALWLAVASFWALTPLHAFRLSVVLPLALGAALLGGRTVGRAGAAARTLREDLRRLGRLLGSLGLLERGILGAVLAVALLRGLHALAAPPLGWDDLTYHLLKAGRFVQAGGFVDTPAPDAWGVYGYLAVAGEIVWSWAMLPFHGDALIAPASLGVWGLAVLGVYAGARALGAARSPALLAALAVGAMPAALAYVGSGYVDNLTLAGAALGSVFVVRLLRGAPLREAPLAVAGLALAAGTKLLGVPLLALGGAAVLLRLAHGPATARARAGALVATVLACAVAAPTYVRTWAERGSPLYPLRVQVAGVELSPGNAESEAVAARILRTPRLRRTAPQALAVLLFRRSAPGAFLGPGPAAPLLLLFALLALPRLTKTSALAALYVSLVAATLLGAYWSGAMELFRTTYMAGTTGRYLLPAFAALGALSACGRPRVTRAVAGVATALGVLLAVPWAGWRAPDAQATAWVLVPVAGLLLGGWAAARLVRSASRPWRVAAAVVALLATAGGAAGVEAIRRDFRYPIYSAAARRGRPTFLVHSLAARYAAAWPVWQALDGAAPRTIAVAAGFDRLGHNWYLYPLLGSRLQNRVVYVPVTESGVVLDYRRLARVRRRACRRCWLQRLAERQVTDFVLLAPRRTLEEGWVARSPERFELEARGGLHAAYRVHRRRLAHPGGAGSAATAGRRGGRSAPGSRAGS